MNIQNVFNTINKQIKLSYCVEKTGTSNDIDVGYFDPAVTVFMNTHYPTYTIKFETDRGYHRLMNIKKDTCLCNQCHKGWW